MPKNVFLCPTIMDVRKRIDSRSAGRWIGRAAYLLALVLAPLLASAQGRQLGAIGGSSLAPRNSETTKPTLPPSPVPSRSPALSPRLNPNLSPAQRPYAEYDFPAPWTMPQRPGPPPGNAYRSPGGPPPKAPILTMTGTVNWLSLEEALERNKIEKRKIYVNVHTLWGAHCQKMDAETFANASVAAYLNENYYPVKLDAETTREIRWKDKTYKFKSAGKTGYNELVQEWMGSRMSFPGSVFLDEQLNLIQSIPGYRSAEQLLLVLQYFGEDHHKSIPWETYERKNKPASEKR